MTPEKYKQLAKLHEELLPALDRAIATYERKAKAAGIEKLAFHTHHYIEGITEIDDVGVTVNWSETWSYGGYDNGSYTIPAEMLYSETYEQFIDEYVEKQRKQETGDRIRILKERQHQKEAEELKLLKELTAKYGEQK